MQFNVSNSIRCWKIWACSFLVFIINVNASADPEVYRYVDENGAVTFSSSPPASETETERVDIPKDNALPQVRLPEERKKSRKRYEEVTSRVKARIEKRKTRAEKIAAANQEVKERKEALEKGKVPLPGERVGTIYGYSRLRQSYHVRVKALEEQLAAAEERLKVLLRWRD